MNVTAPADSRQSPSPMRHLHCLAGRLLRGGVIMLALMGPMLVGVVPTKFSDNKTPLVVGAAFGFALAMLWTMSGSRSPRVRMTTAMVVSCLLTVTLLDVVARPLLLKTIGPGLIVEYPPMPLVRRYLPNVRFRGTIYGEMARDAVMRQYRQFRDGSFATDPYGFRNARVPDAPLDVMVAGDSYAMGDDTAQPKSWSALLSEDHGLHVYNFGVGGNGPWHEFTTLELEVERLKLKPRGTVVLWMLFTGNDLADDCYPIFDESQLPWRRGMRGFATALREYQQQSPWRIMWARFVRNYTHTVTWPGIVVKSLPDGSPMLFDPDYAAEAERSLEATRYQPHYACVRETIVAMKRLADARHLFLGIMVAPPKEEVYSWLLHDGRPWSTGSEPSGFASAVRDIVRAERIPFVDMKPALVQASRRVYRESKALLYWPDDTHWNLEGNKEAAAIAYQFYLSITRGGPAARVHFGLAARH